MGIFLKEFLDVVAIKRLGFIFFKTLCYVSWIGWSYGAYC